MRRLSITAMALGILTFPAAAWACATCGCGDPSLTVMGAEQPYAGRMRFSGSLRAWGNSSGVVGVSSQDLRELRMDLGMSYAPLQWLMLSAILPLQARGVSYVSLLNEAAYGLGDVEVAARAFVFRDRAFAPKHLIGLIGGVKTPSAPLQRDHSGRQLSLDAQLGSGSWDPFVGANYSAFLGKVALYVSAIGYFPTTGFNHFRSGMQLRTTAAFQYQFDVHWAARLALDTRTEAVGSSAGAPDGFGSGFFAYASPDVLWSPTRDLLLQLGIRVPFVSFTPQPLRLLPIIMLSAVYDL